MRFNILGPLEVIGDDGIVLSIGGPKKRAILAYLLLHANEVVATSQLVTALWPGGAPPSARKMIQNTVSGIRAMLARHDRDRSFALLTNSPGYLLRTGRHGLDLVDFHQLAKSGRQALADGAWAEASELLGQARRLWRGDTLADLVDAGVDWPELATLREARRTAAEDYFESELAEGRHDDHLAELYQLLAEAPHRERACHQFMVALYRCGRQGDALSAYQRTRAALNAAFGIEPTPALREVEQAILRQDHALAPQARAHPPVRDAPPADAVVTAQPRPGEPVRERKLVSILTAAFDLGDIVDHDGADQTLAELRAMVRAEFSAASAVILGGTGSSIQAVFGVPRTREQDALTAVRTALAIRDRFAGDDPRAAMARVRLSVLTTTALVTLTPTAPEVISLEIEECLRSTAALPPGRVWVCSATRHGTGHDVAYTHNQHGSAPWCAWDIRQNGLPPAPPDWRLVEREHEFAILGEHLDQVVRHGRGHLITVLGAAGIGKSHLVAEFARTVQTSPGQVGVIGARITRRGTTSSVDIATAPGCHTVDALTDLVTSARHPLVLLVEDLHRADDDLLRRFDALAEYVRQAPVLMISTARPDLARREWCWTPASTSLVLDRISDDAVRTLWTAVFGENTGAELALDLIERISGIPMFAVEFALQRKHSLAPAPPTSPPHRVYRVIAAELDALPPPAKEILKSAAALAPQPILPETLAVLVRHDTGVVQSDLDDLTQRRFLRRKGDGTGYEFTRPLVRDVAYSQAVLPTACSHRVRPGGQRQPDPPEQRKWCRSAASDQPQ